MDGLQNPSNAVVANLAKSNAQILSLDGIETVTPEMASSLAQFTGNALSLNGVERLDLETATALGKFQGKGDWRSPISFDNLKVTDLNIALALGNVFDLNDFTNELRSLDAETAAKFATLNEMNSLLKI